MKEDVVAPIRPLKALLVEDDASDAYLVQYALESGAPGTFDLRVAASLEAALPVVTSEHFDVALLDLSLPGVGGLEAVAGLHHAAPRLPMVVLTGHDDEALATASLQHGAQDYLVKERADGPSIKRAVRYAIERKHFEDNLTVLANYDPLTGIANRALFESRLDMALARARRSSEKLAVFFLDLDGFKAVNDKLGHNTGDLLLKGIAARLSSSLRDCDTVARFGGDEFAVLVESDAQPRACAIVACKLIDAVRASFTFPEGEASVGVSIGIATGDGGSAGDTLMQHADAAMYRAKESGGNCYQFYTEHMHQETVDRLDLEHALVQCLQTRRELCIYYQPRLDVATGRLAGAEALLRWDHPRHGVMTPGEFLPLLPPSMAGDLDVLVLERVCRDIGCWQTAGLQPTQVSVHLSSRRWESASGLSALLVVLKKAGLTGHCLAMEIEESAILQYGADDAALLSRVRETGIEVHLNNVGGGLSSLKLLARCPLDAIKIDRGLTAALGQKNSHAVLVKALVDLGHQLGMKVVAEGVEKPEQRRALAEMHCDQLQGFIVSRPMPADDFFQWMSLHAAAA